MTKPSRRVAAVVMAAGKGKRLRSNVPKVLHPVCGRPALWHVLQALRAARPDPVVLVVGHRGQEVETAVRSWKLRLPIRFVEQGEQLGTGHAVTVAERAVGRVDDVVVIPGDEPLLLGDQVRELMRIHRRRDVAAVVQTTVPQDPRGYGRVIRDGDDFVRITEGADASPRELAVTEVATSVYAFRRDDLFKALPLLTRENRQNEYYLHEVLSILLEKGERIAVQTVDNGGSVGGNSRAEVAAAAKVMRRRINQQLMDGGVLIVDPEETYVDVGVRVGPDTTILPQTYIEGDSQVGEGCTIGPSCRIEDSKIADGATVELSVIRGSRIGLRAVVGPFTHIRPGTVMGADTKAGSFVEIKASRIGDGSKVPHLSYVGDATIGKNANIGAGTVTVNYDGYEKHRTVIGDDVRLGSDTMLVAPVRIGKGAVTGAGSVITRNVPAGALAVERTEQRVVKGYRARKDAKARKGKSGKHGGER
ncbi:MAG: bifunctional UDP-N-acetylglucosamine diphosphorylase/glucosamine-1-phosphate N-acetyltransferase GlmU [Actinomycetota bacterium]